MSEDRRNILWIIAEDLSPDLGCYGNALVKTPNIDNLAGEGARYTNAFTTSPVCSPSRSAFMTAMYQTSIGVHHHRSHRYDGYTLSEPVKVITEYFRAGGYFSCNCAGLNRQKPGKTDFNFSVENPYDGTDWRQRRVGQQFFAQINFSETHRPFKRDTENPIDENKVKLPPYYPDHRIARRDWADYLEHIQILDEKVGNVLKRLEEDGLADNTIVFFFGDHGRPHVRGKQFLYEGGIRVPLIIRWPGHIEAGTVVDDLVSAIDFGPTSLKLAGIEPPKHMQGQVFIGPDAKKREFVIAARDRCDGTVDRIRCVRTKRFKYIRNYYPNRPYMQFNLYKKHRYPVWSLMQVLYAAGKLTPQEELFMACIRPREELYDLQSDPHEINNLADNAEHQETLKKLRGILDKWIEDTGDQGGVPEDPQIGVIAYQDVQDYYEPEQKKRGLSPSASPAEYLKFWEKTLFPACPKENAKKK
ncbi:MAG: sulfatase [Planctomycetota bacterium]|nr:MAG: sulfatase [Planctomycetota bacterium]